MIPDKIITQKIYRIRDKNVILDKDIAELYNIETKQLKRAVRRNISRFPIDFMFDLNHKEFEGLRSQFGTSSWGGIRYAPMAFTEHGVLMLSSVLNSNRAIKVNIQIIRVFTKMRELLSSHKEILQKLEQIERKDIEQDEKIKLIFNYIKQLEKVKQEELKFKNRPKVGFKSSGG
ncbi:MAG: ORF6N domain-containing protein [Bacteroidales bacterium]|nr:ORF6N domain-containing protein [Bacteroidales bacterium]